MSLLDFFKRNITGLNRDAGSDLEKEFELHLRYDEESDLIHWELDTKIIANFQISISAKRHYFNTDMFNICEKNIWSGYWQIWQNVKFRKKSHKGNKGQLNIIDWDKKALTGFKKNFSTPFTSPLSNEIKFECAVVVFKYKGKEVGPFEVSSRINVPPEPKIFQGIEKHIQFCKTIATEDAKKETDCIKIYDEENLSVYDIDKDSTELRIYPQDDGTGKLDLSIRAKENPFCIRGFCEPNFQIEDLRVPFDSLESLSSVSFQQETGWEDETDDPIFMMYDGMHESVENNIGVIKREGSEIKVEWKSYHGEGELFFIISTKIADSRIIT
ncbi:MAG: hypothetical protein ABJN69_15415 [Hellea sp.]